MRAGRGAVGHFGIAKLLVFLWRLISFPVVAGTPVAVAGCPGQYVFDPTGRQIPLFLPTPPVADDFGTSWAPALEWQVPGPLTSSLEAAIGGTTPGGPPYPSDVPARYSLSPGWQVTSIWPELGRFAAAAADSPPGPLTASYQYGFPSLIGAGPYDRDLLGDPPVTVAPETLVSGGTALTRPAARPARSRSATPSRTRSLPTPGRSSRCWCGPAQGCGPCSAHRRARTGRRSGPSPAAAALSSCSTG